MAHVFNETTWAVLLFFIYNSIPNKVLAHSNKMIYTYIWQGGSYDFLF